MLGVFVFFFIRILNFFLFFFWGFQVIILWLHEVDTQLRDLNEWEYGNTWMWHAYQKVMPELWTHPPTLISGLNLKMSCLYVNWEGKFFRRPVFSTGKRLQRKYFLNQGNLKYFLSFFFFNFKSDCVQIFLSLIRTGMRPEEVFFSIQNQH